MKNTFISAAVAAVALAGCTLFSGELHRRPARMILIEDNPPYYLVDAEGHPGEIAGTLSNKRGDTIETTGRHDGPGFHWYYLVATPTGEVYITIDAARTLDEHLYMSLEQKFRVRVAEDPAAWGRATAYIARMTKLPIVVSSQTLVRTDLPAESDTVSIGYQVTRVPLGEQVEYEITPTGYHPRFDAAATAQSLAFFMITGREYQ